MNATGPILPREPFDHANRRVNEWRGHCVDAFSRVEGAVTECLVVMAGVPGRGSEVRLPHLVGQRFDALASAIAEGAPFACEGRAVAPVLVDFRAHDGFRSMLCHGVGEVTLGQHGRWTLALRVVALKSRRVEKSILVLREDEADRLRDEVVEASRSLCARVGALKGQLSTGRSQGRCAGSRLAVDANEP